MIPQSEIDYRERTFRKVRQRSHLCRSCHKIVIREQFFVRRDDGSPWVDPFQAGGVAMFLSGHWRFCRERRWWRRHKGFDVDEFEIL